MKWETYRGIKIKYDRYVASFPMLDEFIRIAINPNHLIDDTRKSNKELLKHKAHREIDSFLAIIECCK